jgi:penicillin-binding protein 1A
MTDGASPKARPPKRGRGLFGSIVYWGLVLGVWGAIFLVGFLAVFARDLPDTSRLYEVSRQPSISYLDRNGGLIAVRGSQEAPPADLERLPAYVPAAFIAIEDQQFYRHFGFNPIRMGQAILNNQRAGRITGGGSTITQQLAKNLFLSPEQTVRRKAQELILAVWLETKFTKEEILALYLNRVYFGGGAYGIEAASQRYFNKPAEQLTLGEAALLAGLLKGPSRYSPLSDSDRAAKRATVVLNEMVESGAVTPEQRAGALKQRVKVNKSLANQHASYFIDWVDKEVRLLAGETSEDLIVETTLDLPIQAAAERAVQAGVKGWRKAGVRQAALVAMDGEGRVRALIGGTNYSDSQFNRAVDSRRQVGSAWKPFVYLTALEQGRTPETVVVDEPITIGNWSPKNYTGSFLGPIRLETAVENSINTVAARLAQEVGTDNVARTASRLGIESTISTQPSMALGAVDASPLELAQAYVPFSNGGWSARGYGIERIRTRKGEVLYERRNERGERASVVGNPPLRDMNRMLRRVVSAGTGTRAQVPGFDLAGKTGTTSDYRDAWFAGYTGGFTTVVWVGKDDNRPMGKVTGGSAPAQIWRDFMASALPRLQVKAIPDGPADTPVFNDPIGDLLAGAGDVLAEIPVDGVPYIETPGAAVPDAPAPLPAPRVDGPLRPTPPALPAEADRALDELFGTPG